MKRIKRIEEEKLFAVLRNQYAEATEEVINALQKGGINIVEIVIDSPDMVKVLEKITKKEDRPLIMAGGIITQRQAQIAIEAGADIIVSPVSQMNLVRLCQTNGVPLIMTTTTPNEAYSAWKARTQLIKISPANPMGGAEYIEDLLRPMKFLNVIASGSIKIDDIQAYLRAGAKAVGLGRALYKNASYEEITERARLACEKIKGL